MEHALETIKKAKTPKHDVPKWTTAIKDGDPYALVAILLSQLHNLEPLRLNYTFVWQSGFPGLMLKHALFSAPEGTMSKFSRSLLADYGSNVPYPEWYTSYRYDDGYPVCDPKQFMAWLHLPSVQFLLIWLQNFQNAINYQEQLKQVTSFVLARSPLTDREVYSLLKVAPNLRALHMGIAYHELPLL